MLIQTVIFCPTLRIEYVRKINKPAPNRQVSPDKRINVYLTFNFQAINQSDGLPVCEAVKRLPNQTLRSDFGLILMTFSLDPGRNFRSQPSFTFRSLC